MGQVRGGTTRKRMSEDRSRERRRNGMRKAMTKRRRRGRSMSGVEEGAAC